MKIGQTFKRLKASMILTSRGEPTIEVELVTSQGSFFASCPSGASTGSYEAHVILDKELSEYNGKGVKNAISIVENIINKSITNIYNLEIDDQEGIDKFLCKLDGTENKKTLGANVTLPISVVFCRAAAHIKNISLHEHIANLSKFTCKMPRPCFNVINGGVHSGNELLFQEVMISFNYCSYELNLEHAVKFYNKLKCVIKDKFGDIYTAVGDEGGFAPPVNNLEDALSLIMKTHEEGNFEKMNIFIDCAANEFYKDGNYIVKEKDIIENMQCKANFMIKYYGKILKLFPSVISLEDPFHEDDYDSWTFFTKYSKFKEILVVGDDLTVTNPLKVQEAIDKKLCNTLLVKPNQIGTVSETINAVKLARTNGLKIFVSHRSGETEDTFISDFAVGVGADYFKSGAPCRGERVSKYNQLLRIERKLNIENLE